MIDPLRIRHLSRPCRASNVCFSMALSPRPTGGDLRQESLDKAGAGHDQVPCTGCSPRIDIAPRGPESHQLSEPRRPCQHASEVCSHLSSICHADYRHYVEAVAFTGLSTTGSRQTNPSVRRPAHHRPGQAQVVERASRGASVKVSRQAGKDNFAVRCPRSCLCIQTRVSSLPKSTPNLALRVQ